MVAGETNAAIADDGTSVDVEDAMIGAIAIERDEPVLTRNAGDFDRLPGVDVERY
jgi:predicted nucleic acid-binding protein